MAGPIPNIDDKSAISGGTLEGSRQNTSGYGFAMGILTMLFFMWGFITCMNDILIPHLKEVFSLSFTQAMLIQFCFFGAYFLVSLPAGKLVKRIGYQRGIVVGLLVAAFGCFLFVSAADFQVYALFLMALFVLASGITILQVSANPFVTELGEPAKASSRLNLTQAFNSLGTTLAPMFGSVLILSAVAQTGTTSLPEVSGAEAVELPYTILGGILVLLAILFWFIKLPYIHLSGPSASSDKLSLWNEPRLLLGALAIFTYVGAEVSIGSVLVNFISGELGMGFSESQAAWYVSFYWGGAMVGRFIGAYLMRFVDPARLLMMNGLLAVVLLGLTTLADGSVAMWAVLLVGLCNSIMFPTIFSLALEGLGEHKSQGAGILCLAIVGGAIVPLLHGVLADSIGLRLAFLLPCLCYLYITFFGVSARRKAQ
ncbi:sugar MFS transporter [Aestuariicella hydrocarbonica]|uniref:Sugar MFS transporter n=1 Tax=Pseudomaricurvus hydrocarbonicus TaxID=1470433 RepID=A0A9E5JY75_9GAMM|nr:sugar MFS transporter [Aestuariicella hydrocarbonica]NHO66810.1 sugar MFS transporter [Aestuariicella hydrocarbonica]